MLVVDIECLWTIVVCYCGGCDPLVVIVCHWLVAVGYQEWLCTTGQQLYTTMDRHNCALLDGIIATICYYLSAMETSISVGLDFQLDGQSMCWWIDILQVENGSGMSDYCWTDILPVENGPG